MPKTEQEKLLDVILKYVIPKLKKKVVKDKKQSKLEELIEKPIKSFELFLDDLINAPKNKAKKPTKKWEIIEINEKNNNEINEEEIRYSVAFERKKEEDSFSYSVEIKYEENETEEKLNVKVKFDNYSLDEKSLKKDKKINEKEYSIEITKKKDTKRKDNYSVSLIYENNYEAERLSISYRSTIGAYLNRRQEALHNFEDRVPGKHVDILPASVMGGILGFTYLGQDRMTLRDDLIGDLRRMVDIHESIHTPDEYETRVLTDWIMSKPSMKYIK